MSRPPFIAKTNRGPPRRGAFDYLLKDMKDEAPRGWSPLPPPGPGGGGPHRVRVEIEIVQKPPPVKRGYRFGTLTVYLILIALIAGVLGGCEKAHAAPLCSDIANQIEAKLGQRPEAIAPELKRDLMSDYQNYQHGFKAHFDYAACDWPAWVKLATQWAPPPDPPGGDALAQSPMMQFGRDPPGGVAIPQYDVEAICRRRSAQGGAWATSLFNSCRNKEQDAYNTVRMMWDYLHMGRAWCSAHNSFGMYQSLVGCLTDFLERQRTVDEMSSSQPFQR